MFWLGWILAAYFLGCLVVSLIDSDNSTDDLLLLAIWPIALPFFMIVKVFRKKLYTCKKCKGYWGRSKEFKQHLGEVCELRQKKNEEWLSEARSEFTPFTAYVVHGSGRVVILDDESGEVSNYKNLREARKDFGVWDGVVKVSPEQLNSLMSG